MSAPGSPPDDAALYARATPRIKAMVIDIGIYFVFIVAMVIAADAFPALVEGPWFGLSFVLALNLYEPVLVATGGGTVGHRLQNLRVVRLSDGRHLNVLVAFFRWWVKWLLGVVSFFVLLFTARHQTIHDLATRSVVTVRNPEEADLTRFAPIRTEPVGDVSVSGLRRVVVIVAYNVFLFVVLLTIPALLVSEACTMADVCTPEEDLIWGLFSLLWMGLALVLIWTGWTSRLPGARSRPAGEDPPS
ncbi:MAG: RDD family protein [Longimicrobiales bacterium]|nr:RDD family protein [Longimicrobiales bacterium]